jgi:hypothetical protein
VVFRFIEFSGGSLGYYLPVGSGCHAKSLDLSAHSGQSELRAAATDNARRKVKVFDIALSMTAG